MKKKLPDFETEQQDASYCRKKAKLFVLLRRTLAFTAIRREFCRYYSKGYQ